jgi:hypothetical protein
MSPFLAALTPLSNPKCWAVSGSLLLLPLMVLLLLLLPLLLLLRHPSQALRRLQQPAARFSGYPQIVGFSSSAAAAAVPCWMRLL